MLKSFCKGINFNGVGGMGPIKERRHTGDLAIRKSG